MTKARLLLLALSCLLGACSTSIELVDERPAAEDDAGVAAEAGQDAAPDTERATAAPTAAPTPTPLVPGELTVTDTDAVGSVGDDLLSLVEAAQLANGRLTRDGLSEVEAALVTGDPGPETTDTITIGLPPESAILFPGGDVWIVELFGNTGDTLIGSGVTLTGAVQESGVSHNVMLLGSSDLSVSGFVFDQVTNAIGIESAGAALSGITVENNAFRNVATRDITMRNSVSGGSLADVHVQSNSFEATERLSEARAFVMVEGGWGRPEEPTRDTSIDGLHIVDNTMSAPAGTIDTCITIAGAHVPFASSAEVSGAAVTGVELARNTLSGCVTAIEIAAALVDQTTATAVGNAIRDVTIDASTIGDAVTGVSIHGGFVAPAPASYNYTEPTAATLEENVVSGVRLQATSITAAVALELVAGEFTVAGSGGARANTVADVGGSSLNLTASQTPCVELTDEGSLATANVLEASCQNLSS